MVGERNDRSISFSLSISFSNFVENMKSQVFCSSFLRRNTTHLIQTNKQNIKKKLYIESFGAH